MSLQHIQITLNDYTADGQAPSLSATLDDSDVDVIPADEVMSDYYYRGQCRYRLLVENTVNDREYVLLKDTHRRFEALETVTEPQQYVIAERINVGYQIRCRFTVDDLQSGPNKPADLDDQRTIRDILMLTPSALTIIHPVAMVVDFRDYDQYLVIVDTDDSAYSEVVQG